MNLSELLEKSSDHRTEAEECLARAESRSRYTLALERIRTTFLHEAQVHATLALWYQAEAKDRADDLQRLAHG